MSAIVRKMPRREGRWVYPRHDHEKLEIRSAQHAYEIVVDDEVRGYITCNGGYGSYSWDAWANGSTGAWARDEIVRVSKYGEKTNRAALTARIDDWIAEGKLPSRAEIAEVMEAQRIRREAETAKRDAEIAAHRARSDKIRAEAAAAHEANRARMHAGLLAIRDRRINLTEDEDWALDHVIEQWKKPDEEVR